MIRITKDLYRQGNATHEQFFSRDHGQPLAGLLCGPGKGFTGGALVITKQRPLMQSRPEIVALMQSNTVIFAVQLRSLQGTRGVSRIRSVHRHTLIIIFHEAE